MNEQTKHQRWIKMASRALRRFNGDANAIKKKTTIIQLTLAELTGTPQQRVWEMKDCCSKTTWDRSWSRDRDIREALDEVRTIAHTYRDEEAMHSVFLATEELAIAAPDAVDVLRDLLLSDDENIRIRAAIAIIDRPDLEALSRAKLQTGLQAQALTFLDAGEQRLIEEALREAAASREGTGKR